MDNLTYDLVAMAGISRRNFSRLKRKARLGEPIDMKKKTLQKLIKVLRRQ
jgi:hypothetical protein